MVRWDEINPALIALVSDLLRKRDAPDWEAEWMERRDANRMISPEQGGALYLKVTSCVPVGGDEFRRVMHTFDVDGIPTEDLVEITVGFRRITVQVQAWESEHTDLHWSIRTLEKLRTRLGRNSSMARMLAVNVDITDYGASRKMTQTINGRRWSIAAMDLILTAAFNDDEDLDPTGWIQRIILTSHAQTAGFDDPFPPNSGPETMPGDFAIAGTSAGSSVATGTLS